MGEDLIRWRDHEGEVREGSLFAVFAALARGEAESFPALRPHQREPWHAFCVQVAAMALIRAGLHELPGTEADWRALLLALTPDWPEGEAWSLVVDDWTKPALLQPPLVKAADRADYNEKDKRLTPDELDMLVTAKNHDVKGARMTGARDEDWLFALVTLQTSEGQMGSGNYGISRMNSGYGNRMSLGIRPAGGTAIWFRRDTIRLLEISAARTDWRFGLPLLWLEAWNGVHQLSFASFDELYVEICRRVRLKREGDDIVAFKAGSESTRVAAAKQMQGMTGDPWAPTRADRTATINLGKEGFSYRQMARLLNPEQTHQSPLGISAASDDTEGLAIAASAMVRGQGKTEGLHRRAIPISRKVVRGFGLKHEDFLDRMGRVAEARSAEAGRTSSALRGALIMLMSGGDQRDDLVRSSDKEGQKKRWADALADFDYKVDRIFFDNEFWNEVAEETGPHRTPWRKRLREVAREAFEDAVEAAPRTDMRRLRAHARARNFLERELRNFVERANGE